MPPDRRAVGAAIRAIRQAHGLRQHEVAGPGLTKGHLSHVENGRYAPSDAVLTLLAEKLDVPVDVLAGRVPPLRPLRRIRGISAVELAEVAGMTVARLERIERGTERPHPHELALIARRLGVDVAALDGDAQQTEPVA